MAAPSVSGEKIAHGTPVSSLQPHGSKPQGNAEALASESSESFGAEVKAPNEEPTIAAKNESTRANLQVLGAFFMMFNCWGVANTFGAFQTYYERNTLKDESASRISWIGSIQAFLLLFIGGLCTGPIFDAGYLRGLVVVGSSVGIFGMMMTSICEKYWQIVLAQGIVMGTGMGCLILPSVAVMPQYFTKRRAFATGIAAAGSSFGGVIYPIVFNKLQPQIGFGWATRVMAFMMLTTLMIPITVMRAKVFPANRRPLFDVKVLRDVSYDLFSFGAFFGMLGLYVPFFFITSYGIERGIVDENFGFYLLALMNAGSIFGRIVPNFFADSTGPLNMMIPCCLICAIIAFCWTSITSVGGLVVFCVCYGCFSGTFVSATGPALAVLSPDIALVGTHMGMSFGFSSLGLLIGNPVAGALLPTGWIAPSMFCGGVNILAALCVLAARLKKTGMVLWVKA